MTKAPAPVITLERAHELFAYDKATGHLTWRVDRTTGRGRVHVRAGDRAGSLNQALGYRYINVEGRQYPEHRLIFFIVEGRWPQPTVDHKDHDRANNRWANLREATRFEQNQNTGARCTNLTGLKGVTSHKSGKFQARIVANGKARHLGTFDTEVAAHQAYCRAARVEHREFANTGNAAPRAGQGVKP